MILYLCFQHVIDLTENGDGDREPEPGHPHDFLCGE